MLLKYVLSSCCLVLMLLLFLMLLVALWLHLLLLLLFIICDWANQLPCAEGRPLRGRPSAASSLPRCLLLLVLCLLLYMYL